MARTAATRGAFQTRSPKGSRRGNHRWWAWNTSTTLLAERHCKNVSNTNARRAWASWLGILCTVPWLVRTRPVGSVRAKAPRSALWRRPAVRRAFMVWRSHSDRVPFNPNKRRPLTVAGSYMPSLSAIRHPLEPHRSKSGYQSEQLRDNRVTS